MKRLFLFMIIVLFVSAFSFGDELAIHIGDAGQYNDTLNQFTDTQYAIKYDTDSEQYYFYSFDWITKAWMKITTDDLATLRNTIDKYLEWEALAIEKQTEIEKEIPDSSFSGELLFLYGDDFHSAPGFTLSFIFFSRSPNRHELVILSNKVESRSNDFIDYELDALYLMHEDVIALQNGVSEANIEAVKTDFVNRKSAEDDFN